MKFRAFLPVVNPLFTLIRGKSGCSGPLISRCVEVERRRCCPCQRVRLKPRTHTGATMRPVPWHVKGVHPDVRGAAREAARRSGLSVGAWLNTLIIEAADKDVPQDEPPVPAPHGAGPLRNPRPSPPPADDH